MPWRQALPGVGVGGGVRSVCSEGQHVQNARREERMRGPGSESSGDDDLRQAYSESCNIILSEWLQHGTIVPPYLRFCFLWVQSAVVNCSPKADDSPLT